MTRFFNNTSSLASRLAGPVLAAACALTLALPATAQRYRFVSLHPAGAVASEALAASNGQQVGSVTLHNESTGQGDFPHATLWHGSAVNPTDLHPFGCDGSVATAIDQNVQAGYAWGPMRGQTLGRGHALGKATNESWIDINPGSYEWSRAYGVSRGQVVGVGHRSGNGENVDFGTLWTNGWPTFLVSVWARNSRKSLAIGDGQQVGYSWQPGPRSVSALNLKICLQTIVPLCGRVRRPTPSSCRPRMDMSHLRRRRCAATCR